jgi:hypothetical protein
MVSDFKAIFAFASFGFFAPRYEGLVIRMEKGVASPIRVLIRD